MQLDEGLDQVEILMRVLGGCLLSQPPEVESGSMPTEYVGSQELLIGPVGSQQSATSTNNNHSLPAQPIKKLASFLGPMQFRIRRVV